MTRPPLPAFDLASATAKVRAAEDAWNSRDPAKVAATPRLADIVEGKLYVFLNAVAFGKYKEDKAGTLAKAEQNWPAMHHVSVAKVNGL